MGECDDEWVSECDDEWVSESDDEWVGEGWMNGEWVGV